MEEEHINWSSFRKRITVNRPLNQVYGAWAIPEKLQTWFLEKAAYTTKDGKTIEPKEQVKKGDHFTWKWHNWDFEEKGEVLMANLHDRIAFTFGPGGNVYIQLKPSKNGTEVELVQEKIPQDEQSKMNIFVGCATGWTFWLTNLKAWLEHGITLHATGLAQSETTDLVNS